MTTDALPRARSKRRKPPPPKMLAALAASVLMMVGIVMVIRRLAVDDEPAHVIIDAAFGVLYVFWLRLFWADFIEEWERWRDGDA